MSLTSKSSIYTLHAWRDNQISLQTTQGEGGIKLAQFILTDDNGIIDLSNANNVLFNGVKRNGSGCSVGCNIIDAHKGIIEVPVVTGMTDISGLLKGSIEMITDNGNIKFKGINIDVASDTTGKLIEASEAFTAYVEALNKINDVESSSNKVNTFDSTFTDESGKKYPTVLAIINYLKSYYYDYAEIDSMLEDLSGDSITEEDLANLKAELSQIESPTFVETIEECTDPAKLYVLPDGYIYVCTEKTVEGESVPNFTNQISISTDTDGSVYDTDGFAENMYLSSGVPASRSGIDCSGFIPIGCGSSSTASGEQVVRLSGITATTDTNFRFAFYDSDKNYLNVQMYGTQLDSNTFGIAIPHKLDADGNIIELDLTAITAYFAENASSYGTTAFIRICCPNIDSNSILTVNEEITYTTTEGGTVQEWVNTGLAFVPADYEDRIIVLENDTNDLKSDVSNLKTFCETGEIVPESVITEASNLVDKAMSREDTRVLRFLISSDAHHKTDHELITKGTKELTQAHGEILKLIGVDFVASLGDITWGSSTSDNATVLEEAKAFNKMMLSNIHGQKQIWTEGNHETDKLTESQIQALIYSHNKDLVQNSEQWIDGYGYMDFENQKVRVICLNTDQATGNDSSGVSDIQLKWLAETALNMDGKSDWSIITMGHHPLSFNNVTLMKNCAYVIEAFILGSNLSFTTNGGTEINVDYSNKNCQYVGHFHGHAHAYSVVKMQKYVSSGVYEEFDAWEICVPNACYERNNQYLNNGEYTARYATETTYSKEDVDGKRTSFNLITVCLDSKKIYADNYGVGIDREISY